MKSRTTAAILSLFLGGIGVHKFYLGRWVQGFIYLLLCGTGLPALMGLIEFFRYMFMSDEAFNKRY